MDNLKKIKRRMKYLMKYNLENLMFASESLIVKEVYESFLENFIEK